MTADATQQPTVNWSSYEEQLEEQLEEGKRNIKWGAGIGAFGAASLAVVGATCPLCFVVAPAFVGMGLWKSHKAKQQLDDRDDQ
ncbi:MAG: hypothetical protein ACQEVA_21460 [Myxococcota bacterium]